MSKLKKIAILGPANSIHLIKWANYFSGQSIDVHVISCHSKTKPNQLDEKITYHSLFFHGLIGYYLNSFQLKRILKKIRPDILNTHYASGYGTLARISRFHPTYLNVWGSDIFQFPKKLEIKRKILQKNLSFADGIEATSLFLKRETQQYTNKKIQVCPFGVDLEKFRSYSAPSSKKITIGTVKSLKKIYGIKSLIDACVTVLKSNKSPLNIKIYGDGPEFKYLSSYIETFPESSHIRLMGKVDNSDIGYAINDFSIFCATSLHESFGVSLIEALACERPIIASRIPAYEEILSPLEGILYFEPDNKDDLAHSINRMIENFDHHAQLAKSYRNYVEKEFDSLKCMSKSLKNLNAILSGKKRNHPS